MRAVALAMLSVVPVAHAGQLVTEHYGLADVRKNGSSVIAGTVDSFVKGKTKNDFSLTVKVTRTFGSSAPAVGSAYTVKVYDGVIWDDPHKSPMEHRLRNAVGPQVAKGQTVYLVPQYPGSQQVELLEGTKENLTRIEVHFDDEARKRWLASESPVLEAALGDEELAGFAFPELARRGPIRAAALLKAEDKPARAYLLGLAAPGRATFFKDALALAKTDAAARDALYDLTCNDLPSAWVAEIAPLMELFPAKEGDEGRRFFDLRDELSSLLSRVQEKTEKQRPDLSPLAPYLARYLVGKPTYRSDDDLSELFPFMTAAGRQQLALAVLTAVPSNVGPKPDDPDLSLLGDAEGLAKLAPSVALLDALGKIDPSKVRVTSSREDAMGSMLTIGLAIAKASPAARRQVQEVLEPWLAAGVDCNEAALKAWRKTMGAWRPGPPVAATFELSLGQLRRLSTGARASFTKDDKAWGFTLDSGAQSNSTWFETDDDWYRELYWKPWLIVLERVGREEKVKLKATAAPPKFAPLDDPKTHRVLEAQAAKDGCPQYEDAEYDESSGTFTYEASGEKGRKCSYRFGIYTRSVQRRTVTP